MADTRDILLDYQRFINRVVDVYSRVEMPQNALTEGYGRNADRKPTCAASDLVFKIEGDNIKCKIRGRLVEETPNNITLREVHFTGKRSHEQALGVEPDLSTLPKFLSILKSNIAYLEEIHLTEEWV